MKSVLGIDVGATKIAGAIVSQEGRLTDRKQAQTNRAAGAPAVVEQLSNFIKQFRLEDVDAVGIGFPGVVENGVILAATNIAGFNNFPLQERLQQTIDQPILIANDTDMALQAEIWRGIAKGKTKVIMLTLGSGIGGAITGKPNAQLGHVVVDPGSVLTCGDGHKGDIEALIGGLVSEKRMGKPMAGLLQDVVFQQSFVSQLTKAIEFLINQYAPEIVVVGGGVVLGAKQYFFNKLPKFSVPVVVGKLGADAGIYGAAYLAMKGGI